MTTAGALQDLADRQAISDLIYRYCRSVDRIDIPLGHSIWHEDGIADYGEAVWTSASPSAISTRCAMRLRCTIMTRVAAIVPTPPTRR